MIISSLNRNEKIAFILIFTFFINACATSTPTPPSNSTLQAAITANEVNIQVFSGDSQGQSLQKFESFNTSVGNRISLDEGGRGVLRFGDRNEVDLFGNTEVILEDAKLESGGSIFVRMKQDFGHTHFKLNQEAIVRVVLETDDSTITTLEQGTEFTVCYAPGNLTCIAVREGALEVTSQAEKHIYRKGEATFYAAGQPPQPSICTREDEFSAWLASMRGQQEVQTLGQLVKSWSEAACLVANPGLSPQPTPTLAATPPISPTLAATETLPATPTLAPSLTPYPYAQSPVLHLAFDEDPDSEYFTDLSGQQHDGSCSGSTCPHSGVPGKIAYAAQFNGIDQYIHIPDSDELDVEMEDSFTIEAWVFLESTHCGFCRIATKYDGKKGYSFDIADDRGHSRLTFYMSDGVHLLTTRSNQNISLKEWHHVSAVFDRADATVRLFVDGQETTYILRPDASTLGDLSNAADLTIGTLTSEPVSFHGLIDNLIIYKAALASSQ